MQRHFRYAHMQEKGQVRTQGEDGSLQVNQETSEETKPTIILTLDFLPPEPLEYKFPLVNPPNLWYLVTVALEN